MAGKASRKKNTRQHKWFIWGTIVALVIVALYQIRENSRPSQVQAAEIGMFEKEMTLAGADNAAPSFSLTDTKGKKVSLSEFKGKVVILDFWATWCAPCRKEIPDFIELYKQYGSKRFQMIGISLDQGGIKDVIPFMKDHGISYPILIGNRAVASQYGGIRGIPTTFVIDKKGNIRAQYVGYRPKQTFEKDILSLLNEK
jgi:cytochrome c biogenesis protein CcmG/thiol:disulfide interchange protein DsbE